MHSRKADWDMYAVSIQNRRDPDIMVSIGLNNDEAAMLIYLAKKLLAENSTSRIQVSDANGNELVKV